jgi:2-keto-4-pentenoate hydratase
MILVPLMVATIQAGENVAQTLFENYKACQPVPLPSSILSDLTMDQAYEVQAHLVANLVQDGAVIAGYKAGLTSQAAQEKFKAPGPVTGVLLKNMQITDSHVQTDPFTKMMLEVEIGYRLNQKVQAPTTPEKVKDLVDVVMPAVEIPDLNFATLSDLTFQDLIADNVCARNFILGNPTPRDQVNPNAVTGQLFMDGEALDEPVSGRAALEDQWKALSWTINNVLENGGQLKKGMVIITGSLGRMYPGKPGDYKVIYTGHLDNLEFSIKERSKSKK